MFPTPIPTWAHLDGLELGVHTKMARHRDVQTHNRQTIALSVLKCLYRRARTPIVVLQVEIVRIKKQLLQSVDNAVIGRAVCHIGFEEVDDLLIQNHCIQVWKRILTLIENRGLQSSVGVERQLQPHN